MMFVVLKEEFKPGGKEKCGFTSAGVFRADGGGGGEEGICEK